MLIPIVLALLVALGAGAYFYFHRAPDSTAPSIARATSTEPVHLPDEFSTPGQRAYYTNDQFGFTFEIPKGFHIEEYGVKDKDPQVLLASDDGQNLILVWMYPVGAGITGKDITADFIHRINTTTKITSSIDPVTIAGADGVAFDSTGETWGVGYRYWFIHNGTLFRVSTSKNLQTVQEAVLSTWRFTK